MKNEAAAALGSIRTAKKAASSAANGAKGGRPKSEYFVVPAPGYYGDTAFVSSSHRTLDAARKAAGSTSIVRKGGMTKGQKWLRAYEDIYPAA